MQILTQKDEGDARQLKLDPTFASANPEKIKKLLQVTYADVC